MAGTQTLARPASRRMTGGLAAIAKARAAAGQPEPQKPVPSTIDRLIDERLEAARRLGEGQFIDETIEITPQDAQLILDKYNKNNRTLRSEKIGLYARRMREGEWVTTTQGLSFFRNTGSLANGQHRLHGVIKAGVPVRFKLTFGEPDLGFKLIDTGAPRNAGDALHMAGYQHRTMLASAGRIVHMIENGAALSNKKFAPDETLNIVEGAKFSKVGVELALADFCTQAKSVSKRLKCSPSAMVAAYYLITKNTTGDDRTIDNFFLSLRDGDSLPRNSPVLKLREGLRDHTLHDGRRGANDQATMEVAATITAWNSYYANRGVRSVKWDPEHPFPQVV